MEVVGIDLQAVLGGLGIRHRMGSWSEYAQPQFRLHARFTRYVAQEVQIAGVADIRAPVQLAS